MVTRTETIINKCLEFLFTNTYFIIHKKDFDSGIGIVEILFRCNIVALVGGGKHPKFPANRVMVWDDYQNKCIAELECRSEVKAVKLRYNRVIVVMDEQVFVYNFSDLQFLRQIKTYHNPKG